MRMRGRERGEQPLGVVRPVRGVPGGEAGEVIGEGAHRSRLPEAQGPGRSVEATVVRIQRSRGFS